MLYLHYKDVLYLNNKDDSLCNKLLTIVNYFLEYCLICIVIDPKASCLLILFVNAAIVSKT